MDLQHMHLTLPYTFKLLQSKSLHFLEYLFVNTLIIRWKIGFVKAFVDYILPITVLKLQQ